MLFGLGPPLESAPTETRGLRLLEALRPTIDRLRWARQVHGREVDVISSERDGELADATCTGECDALLTTDPGTGLLVWTADCVPILLEGPGVVAAVHSGWRGTAADIVGAVFHTLESGYGVAAEKIRAALGPAISGPRYEVGPEVVRALETVGLADDTWHQGNRVDLRLFLAARLRQLGVLPGSIAVVGPCTASTPHLASFRRDGGDAGRQWSLIYRECDGGDKSRRPRN
jgi:YfiH family protein